MNIEKEHQTRVHHTIKRETSDHGNEGTIEETGQGGIQIETAHWEKENEGESKFREKKNHSQRLKGDTLRLKR